MRAAIAVAVVAALAAVPKAARASEKGDAGQGPSGARARARGEAPRVSPRASPARTERLKVADPGMAQDEASRAYFTDTVLVDQHGVSHKLYSDLMRNRIVLLNFAFASCKDACSPITANLARVQSLLGDRVGKDVVMLTLTVDPANDSPAVLQRFAAKFGVKPGWHFLSGPRANVEKVLRKLGGYTEDPAKHSTALVIGDTRTGHWIKTFGMQRPDAIVEAVERINEEVVETAVPPPD